MRKDEIIELLKEQLARMEEHEQELLRRIDGLMKEIASLRDALLRKGESLEKQKRISRGLGKIVSNTSEKQPAGVQPSGEELKAQEEARAAARKTRKNNGAKRDMHYELETEEYDIYPDDPDFDRERARLFSTKPRISIRYECIPMRFVKKVYRIHTYVQDGRMFEGKTPPAAFQNSSYDGSFIAALMELRYIQSLPVERIVSHFNSHGFQLHKSTAHKLIQRASVLFENLYKCIRKTVLGDDYIAADETYYRILLPGREDGGKGVRKGYLWMVVGMRSGMLYLLYDKGSRSGDVILGELEDYRGIVQSDGYAPYRKLEGKDYPQITRIPCLQHIKRKFLDCGEDDPDAKEVVTLINRLYHEEHRHKVGKDDWTVEQNLEHRRKYAPGIMKEISDRLDAIQGSGELLPGSNLHSAVTYIRNEWEAMGNIFEYGDTSLDNNLIERFNRYLSISRRNSLFFGSHEGAERGTILYTIALSCRMQGVNLFEYLTDIINRTAGWQQTERKIDRYRDLLPDRWKAAGD